MPACRPSSGAGAACSPAKLWVFQERLLGREEFLLSGLLALAEMLLLCALRR